MNTRQAMSGFTMIEMMVTISILGILMATAMPAISLWIGNARIRTTSESILNAMHLARSEAVRTNARIQFSLDNAVGTWTIRRSKVGGAACEFDTGVVVQAQAATSTSSNTGISVSTFSDTQAATGSTALLYIYGPNGWQACTSTPQFGSLRIDSTTMTAADSRDLRIVVPLVGRARLCDPNVSAGDTRACPAN